jgi:hypothetical protein
MRTRDCLREHSPSQRERPRGPGAELLARIGLSLWLCTTVTVNSHGLIIPLTSSRIREYQVSCQGFNNCHLWLLVPATIQNQNQRPNVCVRDHTPSRARTLMSGIFPVKIVKVLGEGGFSFVYLAQDEVSGVSASSCDYFERHSH